MPGQANGLTARQAARESHIRGQGFLTAPTPDAGESSPALPDILRYVAGLFGTGLLLCRTDAPPETVSSLAEWTAGLALGAIEAALKSLPADVTLRSDTAAQLARARRHFSGIENHPLSAAETLFVGLLQELYRTGGQECAQSLYELSDRLEAAAITSTAPPGVLIVPNRSNTAHWPTRQQVAGDLFVNVATIAKWLKEESPGSELDGRIDPRVCQKWKATKNQKAKPERETPAEVKAKFAPPAGAGEAWRCAKPNCSWSKEGRAPDDTSCPRCGGELEPVARRRPKAS